VRKWIAELTEELRTKYDLGFRPGIYVLPAADKDELPDGFWIVFPPTMPAELAYGFMEAGHETMRKFIESGTIERLRTLHKYNQDHPQAPTGNSYPNGVQPPKE
jgi:hypothetical protein